MVDFRAKITADNLPIKDIDKKLDTLVRQGSITEARALLAQIGPNFAAQFDLNPGAFLSRPPLNNIPGPIRNTLSQVAGNLLSGTSVADRVAARQKTNLGLPDRASPNDLKTRIRGNEDNRLTTSQPQREQSSGGALNSSGDNLSVRSSAPLAVEPKGETGISDNVLNDYVNLQYHIVMSLVPRNALGTIQTQLPIESSSRGNRGEDNLRRLIENDGSVVFASTGEVFESGVDQTRLTITDTVVDEISGITGTNTRVLTEFTGRNYYNIKSIKFDTVMAPSKENPYVNQMLGIKMIMMEPHGFKIHEDMRTLADSDLMGYRGINQGRLVWRVDIFFSGYNQDTGEWTPAVTLDARGGGRKCTRLTYYLMISKMQAKVDHTGTTYDIDMVPFGHVAYRPEEMTLEAMSVFNGTDGGNAEKTGTFGGFLKKLETALKESKDQRTHMQIKRKYEFTAPEALLQATFFEGEFASKHGFIGQDPGKGGTANTGRDVDVIDLISSALNDMQFVWDKFLADKDPQFVKPRIHWGVRFNAKFENGAKDDIYDFDTIVLQYIIEPFVTYKKASIENKNEAESLMSPVAQLSRLEEMLRLGMVNRVYDYIHTADNTEVIDFDITLKLFYYHAMYTNYDNPTSVGNQQANASGDTAQSKNLKSKEGNVTDVAGNLVVTNRREDISTDSALQRLFGAGLDQAPPSCFIGKQSSAFDKLTGGFNEYAKDNFYGSIASAANRRKQKYNIQAKDHLENDLMRIDNLQVRGDPIWLLTPYGVESGNSLAVQDDSKDGTNNIGIVQTQGSRIIYLRMFAPNQDDYMNPGRMFASSSCNVIGGFYEIYKVSSVFEGGKFTQTLMGAKIDHLNFIENFISDARKDQGNQEASTELISSNPPASKARVDERGLVPTTNSANAADTLRFLAVGGPQ